MIVSVDGIWIKYQ